MPRTSELPRLIGVIHLGALPGSPRYAGRLDRVIDSAARDAEALARAGFDGILVENYGDAPFARGSVDPVTVAAMTTAALRVRSVAAELPLAINVLRNDAQAALAIAVAVGASMVRINVHVGARVTDQGVIEGDAHGTLRQRKSLGADSVRLLCDVAVKHSAPLAPRPIGEEAGELVERGLADAVLVTGSGTGAAVDSDELDSVADAVGGHPVYVASGVRPHDLARLSRAHGVIVGSILRRSGKAGDPIDARLAREFVAAWKRTRRSR